MPSWNRAVTWTGWQRTTTPEPYVTESQVLGLPAAGRAVRLIANAVAQMAPARTLEADGVTPLEPVPSVVARPNATYGVTEWWRMVVAHYLTTGNFVGLLADADPVSGWPRQVVPVNSALVSCRYSPDGRVSYDVGDLKGLTQDDVVHVRAFTVPGNPWGIGVVDAYRRSLGLAFDQRDMAAGQYQGAGIPAGILKPGLTDFSTTQATDVQDTWVARFAGGNRRPAVLPDDWEFQPIAWSPEAMEFLSSRAFTVAEVALMFDLDPSDLGSSFGGGSSQLTYANLTQRQTARLTSSVGPHLATFEDAWSDLVPGGNLVRFRRENYTHASRADLFAEQAVGIASGVLLVDEARAELNMPPLPEPPPPPEPPLEVPSTTGPAEPAAPPQLEGGPA
jgi:HK97 family phage portal protein